MLENKILSSWKSWIINITIAIIIIIIIIEELVLVLVGQGG